MSMPTIRCGVSEMPVVGFGTSRTENPGGEVEMALNTGYRHFDCALLYGNEVEIGKAFTKVFSKGDVTREDVFIVSKLWCTAHRNEHVESACDRTLTDLQLDYLDLYLIHWPMSFQPDMGSYFPVDENDMPLLDSKSPSLLETWSAMERLVESGKCRNIGLSNFNISQVEMIMREGKIKPACLQAESHPLFPNLELLEFCKKNDISFVSYSPLGSPGRVWKEKDQLSLLEDKDVLKIAEKHCVTPGQVLIRYQIDKGSAVIPKSGNLSRMKENMDIFAFSLDSSDMDCLNNLYKKAGPDGYRIFKFEKYSHAPEYPF